MSIQEKLSTIRSRSEELSALMSVGNLNGEQFTKLSREYAELSPIVEAMDELEKAQGEKEDLKSLLNDPEMREIASEELKNLNEKIPVLEKQVKLALIPKDEDDDRNAIL
ncbi:MAG: PCRF domain-containing protein, partial [Alphaproteobacteria bacterium]|nr:PCRF domain-containing protein [Alphaproteobacteria bacterium]